MELYNHIRKISFSFFVTIGMVHFLAGLLYANGYLSPTSGLVNRILYLPLVLVTLTYALSNFKYYNLHYGANSKVWEYVLLILSILIIAGLLAIEFLAADSTTPLTPPTSL